MTIDEKTRRKLVDKFLTLAETFPDTPLGMMFGAIAMVIETEAETLFLKKNFDFFIFVMQVMKNEAEFVGESLTYEEQEFFRKFTELADEPKEDFPELIG
jgi:hypothetical protein